MGKKYLFVVIVMLGAMLSIASGQECTDDDYLVHPELLKKALDKVAEEQLNSAGRAALLRLYKEGISIDKNFVNQTLKNLPSILKAMEATEAIAEGDFKTASYIGAMMALESSLTSLRIPMAGQMIATCEIVELSYSELKHQNCLFDIDMSYYRFLEDPKLSSMSGKQLVDYYIANYIMGEGTDPMGNRRDLNRGNLQCYINEEFSPSQRVTVDFNEMNPFGRVTQATIGHHPAVRTASLVMLKDFANRKRLEEQRLQAIKIVNSKSFQLFKGTLHKLSSYPLLPERICRAYQYLNDQSHRNITSKPNLECPWSSKFGKIYWREGYYGNKTKTLNGSLSYENGKWVYNGTWGRTTRDDWGGAVKFIFSNRNKFEGYYVSGNKNKFSWDGSGSCSD